MSIQQKLSFEELSSAGDGRARVAEVGLRFQNWASAVIPDRLALLNIPLSARSGVKISRKYLEEELGFTFDMQVANEETIASVCEAMAAQNILVEGFPIQDCEYRRYLLKWFEGLTFDEKAKLPLVAGKIKFRGVIDSIGPGMTHAKLSPLFKATVQELSTEVLEIQKSLTPPDLSKKRKTSSEISELITDWAQRVIQSRASLLSIPLIQRPGKPQIVNDHICEQISASSQAVAKKIHLTSNVIDAMIEQKIVLPEYSSYECDWRRRLLRWYEGMDDKQKLNIPVYGNKIKVKGFLDQVKSLANLHYNANLPLIMITLDEITSDLRARGVLADDYKTVSQRFAEKELVVVDDVAESPYKRLCRYREVSVGSIDDLAQGEGEPFSPLMHLFAAASLGSHHKSGISNYLEAYRYFTRGLVESGYEGHEPIVEMIGIYSLVRFRKYLEGLMIEDKISSHSSNTLMSSARIMMETARGLKGMTMESFISASGFDAASETDLYRPYSPTERTRISDAIGEAIDRTNALVQPYVQSGRGEDPLDTSGCMKRGFRSLDNARWIFENKLNCVPIGFNTVDKSDPYQKAFINIVNAQNVSIFDIYKSWGVLYARDSQVLAPYIARLSQVTGLNGDSLLSLDVGDFEEHHKLTNRPCLRYWKERSNGAKEYHLDIFFADITWLTTSQGREVRKIFDDVLALTAEIRLQAEPEVASRLFIYRSIAPSTYNQIKSMEASSSTAMNKIFEKFSNEYELLLDSGEPLRLSASRFRPSFVSELIERGVSMREVQVILGHKNMSTTIGYLERLDLNRVARKILDEALRKIHDGTVVNEPKAPKPKMIATAGDNIIFKTPLGGCRNILNPPDFIKKLRGYIPGRPCALYNKCLACDNRLITKANLPDLYAMRRDYLQTLETSRVVDTPYGSIILENLSLLEEILDPNFSDFTAVELEEAERLSEYIETNVIVEGAFQ